MPPGRGPASLLTQDWAGGIVVAWLGRRGPRQRLSKPKETPYLAWISPELRSNTLARYVQVGNTLLITPESGIISKEMLRKTEQIKRPIPAVAEKGSSAVGIVRCSRAMLGSEIGEDCGQAGRENKRFYLEPAGLKMCFFSCRCYEEFPLFSYL